VLSAIFRLGEVRCNGIRSQSGQHLGVASFLVAAVSPVAIVADRRNTQALRQRDRGVLASIVSQDNVVDNVMRNFVEGLSVWAALQAGSTTVIFLFAIIEPLQAADV